MNKIIFQKDNSRTSNEAEFEGILIVCCIDLAPFDDKRHKPYIFPCGHNICSSCYNIMVSRDHKIKCPKCSQIWLYPRRKPVISYDIIEHNLSMRHQYQSQKEEQLCYKHLKRFNFYCKTCQEEVCDECWKQCHKRHHIEHIDIFLEDLEKIHEKSQKVIVQVEKKFQSFREKLTMRKYHALNTIEKTIEKVQYLFQEFIKNWLKLKYQFMFEKVEKEFQLKNQAKKLQQLKELSEELKINQQKFKKEKSLASLIEKLKNHNIVEVDIPRFQKKQFYKVMFKRLQLFYIETCNIIEQTDKKNEALSKSLQDNDILMKQNKELKTLNEKIMNELVNQYEQKILSEELYKISSEVQFFGKKGMEKIGLDKVQQEISTQIVQQKQI